METRSNAAGSLIYTYPIENYVNERVFAVPVLSLLGCESASRRLFDIYIYIYIYIYIREHRETRLTCIIRGTLIIEVISLEEDRN